MVKEDRMSRVSEYLLDDIEKLRNRTKKLKSRYSSAKHFIETAITKLLEEEKERLNKNS